jgi:hypothetical protein
MQRRGNILLPSSGTAEGIQVNGIDVHDCSRVTARGHDGANRIKISTIISRCKENTASQEHLVSAVVCAAKESQRLLRQFYSLQDSSTLGTLNVPTIDFLKTDGQMSADQKVQNKYLRVDVNRIRAVIIFNSFSEVEGDTCSKIEKEG